ncbi:unnamed protein product [Danaus chrysippus]|uniref:(African queen) hypothetical protein n=1 Tax=Danaus chrysippus TaxID=151541 RepID=A0A8J2R0C1_9NEOP|nr:unnamed protein product [Danaus chrysippus]
MTSNSDELDRVRNIVPSARRSIHSQSNNNSRTQNMGKYGLKSNLNLPDPGIDEVDNIMSKIPNTKPTPILNENKSRRYSYHVNEETDDDDEYDEKPSPESNSKKTGFNAVLYIVLPIIACVASMMLYNMRTIGESEIDVYDEQSFYNDVKHLGIKYKVPDNAILKVRTGNDTREIHHLVINPTNLIVQTEKEFMNFYQKDVDERGVMLIKDVDDIPSHLAMAFHYYCDEFNPLVKKSAIFLTLNLAKCTNGSGNIL